MRDLVGSEAETDTPGASPTPPPGPTSGPDGPGTSGSPSPRPDVRRAIARYVPITAWLPAFPRDYLRPEMLAALTSWGVMVPVALAYASLAGMPASTGIVTAMVALTAYAILGTSRHLKVTTSSTMAVMSVAVVTPIAGGDPTRFIALTTTLACIVGVLLVAAGLLRLGFLSEFLAKPVVTGFVLGVSITILIGQLPKLLGVPATPGSFFDQLVGLVQQLPDVDPWDLAIGGGALVLILVLRHIDRRLPAPLVALVVSIVLTTLLGLADKGVAVLGPVPTGVPSPSLPSFPLGDLFALTAGAAGLVFLALGESIGSAREFGTRHGYRIEPDQELVALGASNLATGLFGGFAVDASLSQSATGEAAGNRSQLASLITAALLLATALFLAPLFQNLPQAVLAAIVIASVLGLVDIPEFRRYVDQRRTDFVLSLVALVRCPDHIGADGSRHRCPGIHRAVAVSGEPAGAGHPGPHPGHGRQLRRHHPARRMPSRCRVCSPSAWTRRCTTSTRARWRRACCAWWRLPIPDRRLVILDIGATGDLDVTTADMLLELHPGPGRAGRVPVAGPGQGACPRPDASQRLDGGHRRGPPVPDRPGRRRWQPPARPRHAR